jgi:hypothetical protein
MRPVLLGICLALAACSGEIEGIVEDPDAGLVLDDAAPKPLDDGIAPAGAVPGEREAHDGDNAVALSAQDTVFRVDVEPEQHVAFVLSFSGISGVAMSVDRWDGARPVEIGMTNQGAGLRFLSVLDPSGRRTYWVRARASGSGAASLKVTRTPFEDGPRCAADCGRLIQMPLPNDPAEDGYDVDGGTHFRYWFGRRDLVMMVRHAAHERARAGHAPFFPYDFSQWDGQTPGADVGSLRHASHQRGKDVDLSLYGQDGIAPWRSYCTTTWTSSGRECVAGTRRNFDGRTNARMFASHLVSDRVTMSFLDRELIPAIREGARAAADAGEIDAALVPKYSDGRTVQHWPNHDNHIHVRVSETDYGTRIRLEDEPFEAP